jgi:hypothetical protein
MKAFIHLPFMLESSMDQRVEYSRTANTKATWLISRHEKPGWRGRVCMCKVIDFQGFTAAVLLLLGLLSYGHISPAQDLQQQESDWQLIEITTEILRRVTTEEGNSVAI